MDSNVSYGIAGFLAVLNSIHGLGSKIKRQIGSAMKETDKWHKEN